MKGLYINLENRTDRNDNITKLKLNNVFFSEVKRFNAVEHKNGAIGCTMSHIEVLESLYSLNEKYYIILEDDFCIIDELNFKYFLTEFNKIKDLKSWDVLILTPRGIDIDKNFLPNFTRIKDTQTTSGYIIKHDFIPILVKNFKEALEGLIENKNRNKYSLDQYWKNLQKISNFIYYDKIFGGQLPGYSDIEKKIINYNYVFLQQK